MNGSEGTRAAFVGDKVATGSYLYGMRAVGIKMLKNKLSEFVQLASRGETVLVTDRDRVVAELVAPQANRAPSVGDALLAEAMRAGWLRPPAFRSADPPPRQPVAPLASLLRDLASDRQER